MSEEIGVILASEKTGMPFSALYKWRMWAKKHPFSLMGKQSMNKKTHDNIRRAAVSSQTGIDISTRLCSHKLRVIIGA